LKNNNFRNAFFSAFGSIICICFIAYLDKYFENTIWLIPPFGATMVLVMAVHESPLAQPKNIILGHIFSALSGVIIYYLLGDTFFSIGIAVGLAVFIMMITRTTHPPAGANPIIVILTEQGLNFVLFPVAVGATIIVFFAIIYNKTLKRKYPY
tara:strand:- start:126 stop:584 length:459 start_codon:yes stop_codon:yes gene_type:complete